MSAPASRADVAVIALGVFSPRGLGAGVERLGPAGQQEPALPARRTPIRPPCLSGRCDARVNTVVQAVQQPVIRGSATMQGLAVRQVFAERGVSDPSPWRPPLGRGAVGHPEARRGSHAEGDGAPGYREWRPSGTLSGTQSGTLSGRHEDAPRYGAGRQEGCCLAACGPADQGTLRCIAPSLRPPVQTPRGSRELRAEALQPGSDKGLPSARRV